MMQEHHRSKSKPDQKFLLRCRNSQGLLVVPGGCWREFRSSESWIWRERAYQRQLGGWWYAVCAALGVLVVGVEVEVVWVEVVAVRKVVPQSAH